VTDPAIAKTDNPRSQSRGVNIQYFDPGSDSDKFSDPGGWSAASYTPDLLIEIEPLDVGASPYRQAALDHLQTILAVDEFMAAATDARLAWVGISIALRLTSVRRLAVPEIAEQLGVTEAAVSRATAKFARLAGLDSGGGLQSIREITNRKPPNPDVIKSKVHTR
jgi:hypothetical protein